MNQRPLFGKASLSAQKRANSASSTCAIKAAVKMAIPLAFPPTKESAASPRSVSADMQQPSNIMPRTAATDSGCRKKRRKSSRSSETFSR
eukprot:3142961-Pleurochrysis_carterae.AAC.2